MKLQYADLDESPIKVKFRFYSQQAEWKNKKHALLTKLNAYNNNGQVRKQKKQTEASLKKKN